jgi:hypothetical protein
LINFRIDKKIKYNIKSIIKKKREKEKSNNKYYLIKWIKFKKLIWEFWDFIKNLIILNIYKKWKEFKKNLIER